MKATAELIEFTGKGRADEQWHAAHLLIFTKGTRLNMDAQRIQAVQDMSAEEMEKELKYMASTIPSSWEFIDVTFLLTNVTRACAQQITRSRNASFAMQSQRVTDMSQMESLNPFEEGSENANRFDAAEHVVKLAYIGMLGDGAAPQDARGILPMNVGSNLVAKYNFRAFVELVRARSSLRVQGEYSDLIQQMKAAVIAAWPWSEPFFENPQQKAIGMLEEIAERIGIETGKGDGWDIAKAIDLLRK